jgi:hypothetical protein
VGYDFVHPTGRKSGSGQEHEGKNAAFILIEQNETDIASSEDEAGYIGASHLWL